MLGQRYTTPMVTVVCPVTSLHHMASLQSASSCNCTSYAGMVSLMYNNTREKRGRINRRANYRRQLTANIDRDVIRKIASEFISGN